jgi:cephalosporin hydroxylase
VSLWSDFLTNDQRLIHKWKHYFPAYERHLARFRNQDVVMIEIGCGGGGSLQMWKRYLGPHARIVGVDIRPECAEFQEDQIAVRTGDQSDEAFLGRLVQEFGPPDIVLDDGSHVMSHIHASFRFLYPRMSKSGVYLVEDLHTAYWPSFEGGLRRPGTFIETVKALIDELNADHTRGALRATDFTRSTLSMHVYDSLVAFERGRHTAKSAPQIGRPSKTYGGPAS